MTIRSRRVPGTAAIIPTAGCALVVAALAFTSTPVAAQLPATITSRELLALSPLDLIRLVDERRPPPVSTDVKAGILARLPKEGEIHDLQDHERRKLAAVAPVLEAVQRGTVYAIKVIDVPYAFVGLHERTAVLITRSALNVLSEDELGAQIAHEAAHEYVHVEYGRAMAANQPGRLQDLELVCDVIATVTLRGIGREARSLADGIGRIEQFNFSRFGYKVDPGYPSLLLRRSVTLTLEKRLFQIAGSRKHY